MSITSNRQAELLISTAVTIVGIVMTTVALLAHVAIMVAPGALLITAGGAWLGNAMARHGVRLFNAAPSADSEASQ